MKRPEFITALRRRGRLLRGGNSRRSSQLLVTWVQALL